MAQLDTHTDDSEPNIDGSSGYRISLESVSKHFDDTVAVNDISLEVQPGELLVFLGPSGCGKTTTLRMIAGLETVTEGTISIGTEDVTQTLPQDRDVSMVFQSYALYPHKTVRGNLAFPLGKMDIDDETKEQKIEEVAEMLEITDLLEKNPNQLSGGQRQRVAVGRTIIREPRVFLLDEPLSNLDAKLRVQTRAQLHSLQRRLGTTTVYVTHDQEEALSIADRVVIMNEGEIKQVGTPEEVYTNPNDEFVATFLGDPAINLIDVSDGGLFDGEVPMEEIGIDVPTETARIGVRPEDAIIDGVSTSEKKFTDPVTFELDVIEPLGHTYEATLERAGRLFSIQSEDVTGEPGESVQVRFDTDQILAFDATGRRI
jgi:multiple sugar transport system ATP-binding protein